MVRRRMQQVEETDRLRNWQPPPPARSSWSVLAFRPGKNVGYQRRNSRSYSDGIIPNSYESAYALLKKGWWN